MSTHTEQHSSAQSDAAPSATQAPARVAASSAIAPPYTQCPAIGASPSCAILVVVNADRSVSVLGDPAVGPYDGADDTLVGVQNNSISPVEALTISGSSGSDIFGFDGDGLCAYVAVPCGPTGYEGPGMSFTLDSSSRDRGEVDFDGSGLAALSGTYFSLEGALDAASLKAREGHLIGRYVAVGDSYSSGEGATDDDAGDPVFQDGTDTSSNKCHRSDRAYGARIKADQHVSSDDFVFKACSGAILADFVADLGKAGQWTDGPQLNAVSAKDHPRSDTGLVTLSLGGNDAGFPFVLDDCVDGFGHGRGENGCLNSISRHLADAKKLLADGGTIVVNPDDKVQGISNASWKFCDKTCVKAHAVFGTSKYVTTVPSLAGLYNEIHRRAPSARIRVLQYPYLFPANPPKKCTAGQFHAILATHSYTLTQKEMLRINTAIYDLDSLIANQVILALHPGEDIREVDPRPAFSGHEICSANPWINGVVFRGHFLPTAQSPFSFHPTSTGQRHFADVVEAAL